MTFITWCNYSWLPKKHQFSRCILVPNFNLFSALLSPISTAFYHPFTRFRKSLMGLGNNMYVKQKLFFHRGHSRHSGEGSVPGGDWPQEPRLPWSRFWQSGSGPRNQAGAALLDGRGSQDQQGDLWLVNNLSSNASDWLRPTTLWVWMCRRHSRRCSGRLWALIPLWLIFTNWGPTITSLPDIWWSWQPQKVSWNVSSSG